MDTFATVLALIIILGLIIIIGPLLTIWALNVLFNLGIAFTLKTWFASLILGGLVCGNYKTTKKSS